MPAELVAPELEKRERLDVMPKISEYQKLSQDDLEGKSKVIKDKLLMRPGTHNEVTYTWEDLKKALPSGEEAGLFYDHNDSVANYAGYVQNLKADEKNREIRGDLVVLEDSAYKKLMAGAKWGISPTIDAEKVVKDGKKYAVDPRFHSFSFVLRPAVRDTMLNEEHSSNDNTEVKGGNPDMSQEEKEKDNSKEELAQVKEKLSSVEKENQDLKEKLKSYQEKERDEFTEKILNIEKKIGFTTESNEDKRRKELKEMTPEAREALKSTHDAYVQKLELDKEKKKDEEDKEENQSSKKKKKKYPYPYPSQKMNESSDEDEEDEKKDKENLSSKDVNNRMLEFMREQESR